MKYVLYLPNLFTGCHSTKNNYKGIGKKHKKSKLWDQNFTFTSQITPANYLQVFRQVTVAKQNFDQVVVYEPAVTKVPIQLERTMQTGSRREMKFFYNGCKGQR